MNIIEILREVAGRAEDPTLRERLGDSFARGHKEASGGIVPKGEFDEFIAVLDIGSRGRTADKAQKEPAKQANNILNYFGKT